MTAYLVASFGSLVVGVPFLTFLIGIVMGLILMSIVPLNLDTYKEYDVEQLYYHLYPYLAEDFMDRTGCERIHGSGNMLAGESSVTHVTFEGGVSTFADLKKRKYELYVQEGGRTLETAQEQGEFTGRARGA